MTTDALKEMVEARARVYAENDTDFIPHQGWLEQGFTAGVEFAWSRDFIEAKIKELEVQYSVIVTLGEDVGQILRKAELIYSYRTILSSLPPAQHEGE